MKKILFLILPVRSHYISCFPFAHELQARGYHVTFTAVPGDHDFITAQGFTPIPFTYMPSFQVKTIRGFTGRLITSMLDGGDKVKRMKEFLHYINDFRACLGLVDPEILFIDEHLNHYYFYSGYRSVRTFCINTKLPSGKFPGTPPLNSTYIPSKAILSKVYCQFLWWRHLLKKRTRKWINSLAFLGASNERFHDLIAKRSEVNVLCNDVTSLYDYDQLIGVPACSLISPLLNFPWTGSKDIGLHYWNCSTNKISPDVERFIHETAPHAPLIYCGIGTMGIKNTRQYVVFIEQLVNAIKSGTDYRLVISAGDVTLCKLFKEKIADAHVLVIEHVAQQDLLRYCSLMITHGGLNSVKECIQAGVPMLGISNSSHRHTDTLGNIARIVFHHIGLRCQITDRSDVIRQRIDRLLLSELYKNSILNLRLAIDDSGSAEKAFFFDSILSKPIMS